MTGSGPPHPLRRVAGLVVSHGLGVLAYSMLSPVIVGYTFLTLGTLAFALLGGGLNEEGSLVQSTVLAAVALGDGAWIDRVWRPDLSFEQNALRLFGSAGLVLWGIEVLVGLVRRPEPRPPAPVVDRLKSTFLRLAVFTAILCAVMLVSVLVIGPGEGLTVGWAIRAALTAAAMGGIVFLVSAPALLGWFFVNEVRGPVARAVVEAPVPGIPHA